MDDLILRSKALEMVCLGCISHSGNDSCPRGMECAEYLDIKHVAAVTKEEFEAEAKRRGYKLIKTPKM